MTPSEMRHGIPYIVTKGSSWAQLRKGDRVDVMVTFEASVTEGKKEIKEVLAATILQNVVVVNIRKADKPDGLGAVELLLNPEEAQYAALSVAKARTVTLAVRTPGDTEMHQMQMASLRRLIR